LLEGLDVSPTPKSEWVKEGERCISPAGWTGEVLKVVKTTSLPYVVVRWDKNKQVGRTSITNVRKAHDV